MTKIKVSIQNPTTLKLEEKGEIGDIIDLLELQNVDNSFIMDAINNAKDTTYNSLLEREIQQQEANKVIALNELEKKLRQEHDEILLEKDRLSLIVDTIGERLKAEREMTLASSKAEFTVEKGKLESKIAELSNSIETQKTLVILETEKRKDTELNAKQEFYRNQIVEKEKIIAKLLGEIEIAKYSEREKIIDRDSEIRVLNEQLKSKDENLKVEIEKEKAILSLSLGEQLSQKELEITQLRLAKSNLQVKILGEELERWCNCEFESYALSGFENCRWYKDNKAIKDTPDAKGSKADYIFEVYVDSQKNQTDKLLSVCCEMKNESPETKNKTKNSDYFKKLDDDRLKKKCQYSLLISELEWDSANDVPIKKIPEYENMYMVRPAYFISFLSLIKSLANKYQALLIEHRIVDENFKESQSIIEEFENFKSSYLDKPLASLLKDVEEIKKEANKAYESSYKIVGLADTIISNKISEIRIKIDRFDIKKIARKIEKLNG
jgi:hypothetical protein